MQGKRGCFGAKPEQCGELRPVQDNDDDETGQRQHFQEAMHMLFGRSYFACLKGVVDIPDGRRFVQDEANDRHGDNQCQAGTSAPPMALLDLTNGTLREAHHVVRTETKSV